MRFNEWCWKWLEMYKKRFLKDSTFESYQFACNYITCRTKLKKLRITDLQLIINTMIDLGLAKSTIKHTLTIMVQASRRAAALGYCKPMDYKMLELPAGNEKKVSALSLPDQRLIIQKADFSFYGDFFLFLLFSGLRVGELIALRWSDVSMKNKIISISRTDYRGQEQAVKTKSSQKVIPISAELKFLLERNLCVGNDYVFRNTMGRKVNYRTLLQSWHRFCDSIGIEECGLHVLRHTYATNALRAGVNVKVLSELLGHKSITVTLNIYTDVCTDDKAAAARMMSEFMFPDTERKENMR